MPEGSTGPGGVTFAQRVASSFPLFSISSEGVSAEAEVAVLQTCELVVLVLALVHAGLWGSLVASEPLGQISNWFSIFEATLVAFACESERLGDLTAGTFVDLEDQSADISWFLSHCFGLLNLLSLLILLDVEWR